MSLVTFTTVSVVTEAQFPVAAFSPSPAFGVVGSVVKLDGQQSTDPDQKPLTYAWRFISTPIGSQVQGESFRSLDTDSTTGSPSLVSFSPDVVGEYVIGLVVSNGVFSSEESSSVVSIRAILIPHGRGIIPDGKFIWSYLRDVWSQVEGKEFFETLWSALIQITGSEFLKLYQVDYNKSIRDIQDRFQRRWLSYEPKLLLGSDLTFSLGNHCTGTDASTVNLGLEGQAIILSSSEVVVVLGARLQNVSGETLTILYSGDTGNIGDFTLSGLNAARNGYKLDTSGTLSPASDIVLSGEQWEFDIGSVNWALSVGTGSTLSVGDVIHYPTGPNAGFYRIIEHSGVNVVVDHAPPSFSDSLSVPLSNIYHPVGFKVTQPNAATTNTFSVPYVPGTNDLSVLAPGRMVVVAGQSYVILRSVVDYAQFVPSVIVTVSTNDLLAGLRSLNWRAPSTLTSQSQNFEDLGVCTGDVLAFDIIAGESQATSEVIGQVIGVKGNAIGFVFSNEEVTLGEVPDIPVATIVKLASDFGIDGVTVGPDGSISYSGTAFAYQTSLSSGTFKRKYWNTELSPDSEIQVNPTFKVKPKFIIRNRLIPVSEDLRSVPVLQEFVVQPLLTERAGKFYQSVRGKEFELSRKPSVLTENLEYLVDDEYVFTGRLTINTGSNEIEADDADFLDRSISPGDEFIIDTPLTLAGTYTIEKVLSNNKIRITKAVPAYVLGPFAIANVVLKRKKTGHFLRFVPGLFTAQNPAPSRMWAEVSFFDNNQTVEDNFGILVGLKKDTLEAVSRDINYRQAVAGLMFAYTRGSSIDRVRLGAQILLGLPFSEHVGIIRSIEQDYRLDIEGTPVLGRLLIEDVDSTGAAQGTLRIYTFPIDEASALAGLEINPATGVEYAIGDTVELFAPLSKGVEIVDYITNPTEFNNNAVTQLKKYHSVRLRANDNIFSLGELDLVSDFLKKITPSYIAYALISASEFFDVVEIEDDLTETLKLENNLIDNASLGVSPAMMFDSKSADFKNQIIWENGAYKIRRVGHDLVTVLGTVGAGLMEVSSAAGGFIDPKAHEDFEAPLLDSGDTLFIQTGSSVGAYPITGVLTDTSLRVSGPNNGFDAETGLEFFVGRKVSSQTVGFTGAFTSGNSTVVLVSGSGTNLKDRGIASGDWLLSVDHLQTRFLVKLIKESTPGSGVWDRIEVTPTPTFTEASTTVFTARPSLLEESTIEVEGDGSNVLVIDPLQKPLLAFASIGDELILDDLANTRLVLLDPYNQYVTPPVPVGTYTAKIAYKNHPKDSIGFDHIEKFDPVSEVDVSLVETQALATCTAASAVVTLQAERTTAPAAAAATFNPATSGIRPGDRLVITSGGNSTVDVGQGAGVYPIVEVTASDVTLSTNLTASGSASWKILRRR